MRADVTILVISLVFGLHRTVGTLPGGSSDHWFNLVHEHSEYPRDCQEVLNECSQYVSGVYMIKPDGYPEPFEVYCDNELDPGGWLVFQRRLDASVDFNRTWEEYANGFGFLSAEYWLGNEKLAYLTNQKNYQLCIELRNDVGDYVKTTYDNFRITDDWGKFLLTTAEDIIVTAECSHNKLYKECTCEKTCGDPENCTTTCVSGYNICICPDGFYKDGNRCVEETQCGCFLEQRGVIPEGESYVNTPTRARYTCINNQLHICSHYATPEENIGNNMQCACPVGFRKTCVGLPDVVDARDCDDWYKAGIRIDGVYPIKPTGWPNSGFDVYCQLSNGDGGWTVFQRREDGSEDFYRNWTDYKNGFGNLTGEHWLGNSQLYSLTNQGNYTLHIDIISSDGSRYNFSSDLFRISDETGQYTLLDPDNSSCSKNDYCDSINGVLGSPFSTYDHTSGSATECTEMHKGGWWYWVKPKIDYETQPCVSWLYDQDSSYSSEGESFYCTPFNLNGNYSGNDGDNIFWYDSREADCHIRRTEMKIRPNN